MYEKDFLSIGLLLTVSMATVVFNACGKDKEDKPKTCDNELANYNAAKNKISSDSITFVDWKDSAPNQVVSSVNTRLNQGMSETEVWEASKQNRDKTFTDWNACMAENSK